MQGPGNSGWCTLLTVTALFYRFAVVVSRHVCRLVKMFGDLKSAAGMKALNDFLADNSYVEG